MICLFDHVPDAHPLLMPSNSRHPGHCEANPSFEPFDSGGDGINVPYCARVDNPSDFFLLKCVQQGLWATTGTMTRPSWRTKELT